MERVIYPARHIEVISADQYGHVVHLGERDYCSSVITKRS